MYDKLSPEVTKQGLEQASKLIEAGLAQKKEQFVQINPKIMKEGMEAIGVLLEQERQQQPPSISKEALAAGASLIAAQKTQFTTLSPEIMKKGLEAAAVLVDKIKGKFTAAALAKKSHGQNIGRQ